MEDKQEHKEVSKYQRYRDLYLKAQKNYYNKHKEKKKAYQLERYYKLKALKEQNQS